MTPVEGRVDQQTVYLELARLLFEKSLNRGGSIGTPWMRLGRYRIRCGKVHFKPERWILSGVYDPKTPSYRERLKKLNLFPYDQPGRDKLYNYISTFIKVANGQDHYQAAWEMTRHDAFYDLCWSKEETFYETARDLRIDYYAPCGVITFSGYVSSGRNAYTTLRRRYLEFPSA